MSKEIISAERKREFEDALVHMRRISRSIEDLQSLLYTKNNKVEQHLQEAWGCLSKAREILSKICDEYQLVEGDEQ